MKMQKGKIMEKKLTEIESPKQISSKSRKKEKRQAVEIAL